MRIWIDTDIGTDVDDALALAYVLRQPDLELVGISTVFGDLSIRDAIVRRLLDLAGAPPVRVVTGLSVPLTDGRHGLLFGHEGRAVLDDPRPTLRIETEPGGAAGAEARVEALVAGLDEATPDLVVAIGPLTNLGALARAGVDLPPLTIMGGKFDHDRPSGPWGEASGRRPEWNWYCDPVAVQHVLGLGERLDATVVPAEVTFRTGLDDPDVHRLAGGDRLNQTLAALCREWLRAQDQDFDLPDPRVALHDPLTAAVLVRPELCRWSDRTITVDDRGRATLLDPNDDPVASAAGPAGPSPAGHRGTKIRAAVDVDPPAVSAELLAVLGV
ncbi:MAG: nucleoside hydrolase [Acidimicrobiia bacterium]|nr:nucleoside hydrolase [Acidimicrobiia bacterium]